MHVKAIFLDIDGVLVTHNWWEQRTKIPSINEPGHFDPLCQKLLEDFLGEYPEVVLVLSSTWRKIGGKSVLPTWQERISQESTLIASRIIDITPILKSGNRSEEIKIWLENNPDIKHYAIIDDDSDFSTEQIPNFIQTGFQHGLQLEHVLKIKEILGLN